MDKRSSITCLNICFVSLIYNFFANRVIEDSKELNILEV